MSQSLPKNYTLLEFANVDSSNEEAKRLVRAGMGGDHHDVTVVWAKSQSDGKGRFGRQWISPKGNLYVSLLIKPRANLQTLSQLSFVTALALREAIQSILPQDEFLAVQYKWPNDILIDGKKVAGILLESASVDKKKNPEWLIIGVGVNIASFPARGVNVPATSLKEFGAVPSVESVLYNLIWSFKDKFDLWQEEGFHIFKEKWIRNAKGIGEEISVNYARENICGIFKGINHEGAMVLTLGGGQTMLLSYGEVSFHTADNSNIKEEATG